MDFQVISAIVFIIFLTIFLLVKRKKLDVQKVLFPLLYFVLYRTKLGIKFMKKAAEKHPRFWKWFSYFAIFFGFLGMILIAFELFRSFIKMLIMPEAPPGVAPVLPIPAKGVIYVPFFYWILCIFIIAIVHEFAHGIVSKMHDVKIKSSGFAFLGLVLPIIPAAFVEPDEKLLEKKKPWQQLGVFAAGPFANIVLGIIAMVIILAVINPISANAVENTGTLILTVKNDTPASLAGLQEDDLILGVDELSTLNLEEFSNYVETKEPGDRITIVTNRTESVVVLGENPQNKNKGYIGITFTQDSKLKESFVEKYGEFTPKLLYWTYEFFFWLYLLNIGIGLFNLVPLGPVDGGRMLKVVLLSWFKEKKALKIWKTISLVFLGIILYMLASPLLKSIF